MRRSVSAIALLTLLAAAQTALAVSPHTEAIEPPGRAADGAATNIPQLTSWVVGGPGLVDDFCTGLGWHAGIFWVAGSDYDGNGVNGFGDNGIYLYGQNGTYLGSFPQPTQDQWGFRDGGYDGSHLLFGASGPHAGQIFRIDANTLLVDETFTGCPFATCRGIAVTGADAGAILYAVSDIDGSLATMRWDLGSPVAQELSTCAAPAGIFGLAYDSDLGSLWATTADQTGRLLRLDVSTCATVESIDMAPEVEVFGGAVMAATTHGCNLWTLCQCDPSDRVYGWQTHGANPFACGVVPVRASTWGALKARYRD